MKPLWPCYRLVAHGWATMMELKTVLTAEEVFDLNDALDAWTAAQAKTSPKS